MSAIPKMAAAIAMLASMPPPEPRVVIQFDGYLPEREPFLMPLGNRVGTRKVKRASPAKKAARKRQRKARAITRRSAS